MDNIVFCLGHSVVPQLAAVLAPARFAFIGGEMLGQKAGPWVLDFADPIHVSQELCAGGKLLFDSVVPAEFCIAKAWDLGWTEGARKFLVLFLDEIASAHYKDIMLSLTLHPRTTPIVYTCSDSAVECAGFLQKNGALTTTFALSAGSKFGPGVLDDIMLSTLRRALLSGPAGFSFVWDSAQHTIPFEAGVCVGYIDPPSSPFCLDTSWFRLERCDTQGFRIGEARVFSGSSGDYYQLESKSARYLAYSARNEGTIQRDIRASAFGAYFAELFVRANAKGKHLRFLPAMFLEISKAAAPVHGTRILAGVETRPGKYVRCASVKGENEWSRIADAFSHFSFCCSFGAALITELCGTMDTESNTICLLPPRLYWTEKSDPDSRPDAMAAFFASHKCGEICRLLHLSDMNAMPLGFPIGNPASSPAATHQAMLPEPPAEKPARPHGKSANIVVLRIPLGTNVGEIDALVSPICQINQIKIVKRTAFIWMKDPGLAEDTVARSRYLKFKGSIVELELAVEKKRRWCDKAQ